MQGAQELDPALHRIREEVKEGENTEFSLSSDGILNFRGRVCVPDDPELRTQILTEAHATPYSVHPGATKMYKDLKEKFWWSGAWSKYLPLIEFSYNNSYQATIGMAPYEALYGRKCRSPIHWYETGEKHIAAPDFIETTTEAVKKIREKMETAQSKQKRCDAIREEGKTETKIHRTLRNPRKSRQVSMLKKYVQDPSHVLEHEPIEVHEDLPYEEKPVQILDRKEKTLRNKVIPLVKVLWRNHKIEEATWEREDEMREKYPNLF
ncbi:hypothetical protein UlMin_027365 [Ulmus minor]